MKGTSNGVNGWGVEGDNSAGGDAASFTSNATGGVGVVGTGQSVGLLGFSTNGNGVRAQTSGGGDAIHGIVTGNGAAGVGGYDTSTGGGYGSYGISTNGTGAYGQTAAGSGTAGVYGVSTGTAPAGYFVALDTNSYVAIATQGSVHINGALTVSGNKQFEIDDPLDPANKFLVHSADESPQAENIYNGNITANAHGYATVKLPPYFDAENTDPRYQLTVIGSFAQAVVWKEEQHNQFTISTSQPNVKVSWQITAIRNDPYARSLRAPAEQDKPASERGRYLQPSGYGKPASLALLP